MESRSQRLRNEMVEFQISGRGIFDGRLIRAFQTVPRHMFVPKEDLFSAYSDRPLPIGHGQTISQPYIVAEMCRLSELTGEEKVLEIGTGSGYAAAILSMLAAEVYTIERIHSLYESARKTIDELGYANVHCILGDGYNGYPDGAPFDVVLMSAAPVNIPDNLAKQLSESGRIVAPVGKDEQYLIRLKRTPDGFKSSFHGAVRFVPMKHGFS
ncbi:MAG: protein-L-isoaspartate(D-aspartate) O-methyltransferase [Sediminispirochaetaceae bacterium]